MPEERDEFGGLAVAEPQTDEFGGLEVEGQAPVISPQGLPPAAPVAPGPRIVPPGLQSTLTPFQKAAQVSAPPREPVRTFTPSPIPYGPGTVVTSLPKFDTEKSILGLPTPEEIPSGAESTVPLVTIPLSAAAKTAAGLGQFVTSPKGLAEIGGTFVPIVGQGIMLKWAHDLIKGGVTSAKDAIDTIANMAMDRELEHVSQKLGMKPPPQADRLEQYQRIAEDVLNTASGALGGHIGFRALRELPRAIRPGATPAPPIAEEPAPAARPTPAGAVPEFSEDIERINRKKSEGKSHDEAVDEVVRENRIVAEKELQDRFRKAWEQRFPEQKPPEEPPPAAAAVPKAPTPPAPSAPAATEVPPVTDFRSAANIPAEKFQDWLDKQDEGIRAPTKAAYAMSEALATPEAITEAEGFLAAERKLVEADKARAKSLMAQAKQAKDPAEAQKMNADALDLIKKSVSYVSKIQYFDEGIKMAKARRAVSEGMTTTEASKKFGVSEKSLNQIAGRDIIAQTEQPPTAAAAIEGSVQPGALPAKGTTPLLPPGARARLQGRVKREVEEGVLGPETQPPAEQPPAEGPPPVQAPQAPPAPPTEPILAGKPLSEWVKLKSAADLPPRKEQAALAKELGKALGRNVPNQPAKIWSALRVWRDLKVNPPTPVGEVKPVEPPKAVEPTQPEKPISETGVPVPSLHLKEGNRMIQVTPEQASKVQRGDTPLKLYDNQGNQIAYVSPNGNVWFGTEQEHGPSTRKDQLIYNATGLVEGPGGTLDVPKPPNWERLRAVQDQLQKLREANPNRTDTQLAISNPEFRDLILERDKLIGIGQFGQQPAIDVGATTKPAEPTTPTAPTTTPVEGAAKAQAEVSKVAQTQGQRPAKEVKSELVDRLEKAVADAQFNTADFFPGMYVHEAKTLKETTRLSDRSGESGIPLSDWLERRVTKKSKELNRETMMGAKFIAQALENKQVKKVTIDIPGDGSFTVWNTKDALQGLLDRAKRISTSTAQPKTFTESKPTHAQGQEWLKEAQQPPEAPPPEGTPPGSVGPGAAASAEFTGRENRRRLLSDIVERLFGTRAAEFTDALQRKLAGEVVPKTMARSGESGNKMVRFASSQVAAPAIAKALSLEVLGDHAKDMNFRERLGAVLVEDRLRAIQKGLSDAATRETDPLKQADLLSQAASVNSLVGPEGYFKTEGDFRAAIADPEIAGAIERHKQSVQREAELFHTEAEGQMAGPGVHTGAFVNLAPIFEERPDVIFRGGGRGDYTRPFKRKSVFSRRAKGIAPKYELDYDTLAERMIRGNYEEYTKRQLYDQLVADKLAVIRPPGEPAPEFNGKRGEKFQIRRQTLITRDGGETKAVPQYENLWVDPDIAGELRQAENLAPPIRNLALARFANILNRIQLAGPTDAVWHTANMMSTIAGSQGGKSLLVDLARKMPLVNVVDTVVRVAQAAKKVLREDPETMAQLAELSEIGAVRPQREGGGFTSRAINLLDKAGRLVRDQMYQNLVQRGLVEASEVGRREFVGQLGQYNPRLMGQIEAFFKEAGLSPFIVAGRNFNRMALRRMTLSPGVRAANLTSAIQMRGVEAVGLLTTLIAVPTLLNTVLTGKPMGRPGTPFGAIDTGKDDRNGKHIYIDPAQWVGLRRGMRLTGMNALIEGMRRKQPFREIEKRAGQDIIGAAIHPWSGPLPTMATVAATGYTPSFFKESRDPGDYWQNFLAALRNINPVIHGYFSKQSPGVLAGAESSVSSLAGAAGIKSAQPRSAFNEISDIARGWASRSDNPKIRSTYEQHAKESFTSEYKDLRSALSRGDLKGARQAYQELRQSGKTPTTIRQTLQHPHPFTGSAAAEARFKASLNQDERDLYNKALEERRQLYHKFQQMLATPNQGN